MTNPGSIAGAILAWLWDSWVFFFLRRNLVYYGQALTPGPLLISLFFLSLILIPPGVLAVPSLKYKECISGRKTLITAGDTFRLGEGEKAQTVRLYGVSAPSLRTLEGRNAKQALENLLGTAEVSCRRRLPDPSRRYVAMCTLPDGRDVASVLLAEGHLSEDCLISGNEYKRCTGFWAIAGRITSEAVHRSEGGLRFMHDLVQRLEKG